MPEPAYRVHHIAETAAHRAHSVQCLNDDGVVIALAATQDGDDYGLAICGRVGDSWAIKSVIAVPEPEVRGVNAVGRFAGWSLKAGRERALVGRAEPSEFELWPGYAALTAIDDAGRMVGFRRVRGAIGAFLQVGPRGVELAAPPSVSSSGYYASALGGDRIVGAEFDAPGRVLVWNAEGALIDQIDAGLGQPLRLSAAGHVLCAYGVIIGSEQMWLPYAARCGDFIAKDMNASGMVVGHGRALDDAGRHACLWRDGVSYNLNDVATDAQAHLREATAINNRGWIACSDAEGSVVLLEPLTS